MSQTCTKCVLDTSDSFISFDEDGVCNYCREYERKERSLALETTAGYFHTAISRIAKARKDNSYDCIIGISGGLDSSWMLYLARKSGLNPLAVHYDCGWNSELAVRNIENLVSRLNVDLYTYVVDWNEFRDVQLAYLRAGVVDLEIPTDHSFMAALYKVAAKFRLRYILTGHNFVTEGIMPRSWVYNKGDATNMLNIHRKHGNMRRLQSFPVLGLLDKFYYYNLRRMENLHLLNYVHYDKAAAAAVLSEELGWKQHPVKHGESVWTRFYQCYILPRRFGIDKRRAHLSTLICSGQITRDMALIELKQPVYCPELLRQDLDFVRKKFEITDADLERYMQLPISCHDEFGSDQRIKNAYNALADRLFLNSVFRISYHY